MYLYSAFFLLFWVWSVEGIQHWYCYTVLSHTSFSTHLLFETSFHIKTMYNITSEKWIMLTFTASYYYNVHSTISPNWSSKPITKQGTKTQWKQTSASACSHVSFCRCVQGRTLATAEQTGVCEVKFWYQQNKLSVMQLLHKTINSRKQSAGWIKLFSCSWFYSRRQPALVNKLPASQRNIWGMWNENKNQ